MTEAATWRPLSWTPPEALEGRWARLERLSPRHAAALHAANPTVADHWRYLAYGPFQTAEAYGDWVAGAVALEDPAFYAVRSVAGWTGVLALMRVDRANGVIEIGHIAFSPGLQRTPASTEAIHLLLDHAFASGFRRVEWKCNAENAPSRRAASRLGFTAEGVFRQHMMVRGRNRDTAWFSIIDTEWPRLRKMHRRWLRPGNFDVEGRQKTPLSGPKT